MGLDEVTCGLPCGIGLQGFILKVKDGSDQINLFFLNFNYLVLFY